MLMYSRIGNIEYNDYIGYVYVKNPEFLSVELQNIYTYCKQSNIKLSKVRIDIGNRNDFKHSFQELISKHKNCCIIISSPQQISRDIKEFSRCFEICSKNNIGIYSVLNKQLLNSPQELMENILDDLKKDGLVKCKEI